MGKLQTLMDAEGFDDIGEFMDAFCLESVVPGICMNEGCEYVAGVEPDNDRGWCEVCGTNTVQAATMLLGVI